MAAGAMPWDRPAPEREGLPSAWSMFPEDFASLGCPGSALETFRRLHRPWTWEAGGPVLGPAIRRWLTGLIALVVLMVVIGGATRLTESGLSIVEWKLVSGTLPPLSDSAWQAEFIRERLPASTIPSPSAISDDESGALNR